MRSLVVLAFEDMDGAAEMRERMYDFQKRELITLEDAGVVVRQQNGHAKLKQAHSLVVSRRLSGLIERFPGLRWSASPSPWR